MTAKEFYEANATNVCHVPRNEKDKGGWNGVRRAEEARFIAGDVPAMPLWEVFDFAEKYSKAESGRAEEYCGKSTTYYLIAGAIYYACMLPPNHDGECQPGGNCVVHGMYVGATQCPKWPECVKGLLASHSQPSEGRG